MKRGWECGVVLGMRECEGMRWVEMRREERGVREREGMMVFVVWWSSMWWSMCACVEEDNEGESLVSIR